MCLSLGWKWWIVCKNRWGNFSRNGNYNKELNGNSRNFKKILEIKKKK